MDGRVFPRPFNWLKPRVLLETRNWALSELIRKAHTDIVNDERRRWLAAQRASNAFEGLVVDRTDLGDFSFLAVGDPGEADESQYVTVHAIEKHKDTDFMVVVSDVIYPTGEGNDYVDAFYRPYRDYPARIYALPGNHDWYALLTGFMWNFCGSEPLPEPTYRLSSYSWQERLARFLWLRPRAPQRTMLEAFRSERWEKDGGCGPLQPASYFAIETRYLRIICIDTGTSGTLDREQGLWLAAVSEASSKPKILLTGKPIYVNNEYKPCRIEWEPYYSSDKHPERTGDPAPRRLEKQRPLPRRVYETVDDVVRVNNYIAVIGGDTHNYQRYPIRLRPDAAKPSPYLPRTVQYVVSGGGGAFLSPTHAIPRVGTELDGEPEDTDRIQNVLDRERPIVANELRGDVTEDDFRCYPLRGDSLARMMKGTVGRLWALVGVTFGVFGLGLMWLAWLLANHPDSKVREWDLFWVPFGWLEYINVDVKALPDWNYQDITRGFVVVVVAAAVGLCLLPWFRLRIRAVIALTALVIALFLWPWHLFDREEFLAAALVLIAAPIVLGREWVRERGPLSKGFALVFMALVVSALGIASGGKWKDFWVTLGLVAAVGIVLIGGPPLKLGVSFLVAAVLALLALVVLAIQSGEAWVVALVPGVLAVLLALRYVWGLRYLLFFGGDPRPSEVAQIESWVADRLGVEPVRNRPPSPDELDGASRRRAKRARRKGEALFRRESEGRLRLVKRLFSLDRLLFLNETVYSAIFDRNDPPFFKSFLRVDITADGLRARCFGVADERCVTLEDTFEWSADEGWAAEGASEAAD